ncbi:type VII secretion integral membrane protein EccD [Dactylosporangium sp. NPDC000521]|uniref:type VII secretion integral membrane protein EccD n=1 Tax=Dactylosporangium sp. NPDC000521 TaxID=3363975 RepID=UPI0036A3B336
MTPRIGIGLARVTVATPKRRIDVALPDSAIVAELLPHLLRHAGEDLGDTDHNSGWVLRRATGALVEPARNLTVQGVRDGEILHLVPGRADWPELAYDDVVEVIANGARRTGRSWSGPATRRGGITFGVVTFTLGVLAIALSGPPWTIPAAVAGGIALVLAIAGLVVARALGDAPAGGAVAGAALPYAFAAGALAVVPDGIGVTGLGATSVLLGSAALLAVSVLGYVGTAAVRWLFMAGLEVGIVGIIAGLLVLAGMPAAGSAAFALTLVIGLLPGYPLIASWLGKLPVPTLPDKPEDILVDQPVPKRAGVFAAVARATELLTGMLLASAVVGAVTIVMLGVDGRTTSILLAASASAALLLRARLFPAARQRVPLLAGGAFGVAVLLLGLVLRTDPGGGRLLVLPALLLVGGAIVAAGLIYSRRTPTPYIGRIADITDVVAIVALIPLACGVIGVYGSIQALFASFGS